MIKKSILSLLFLLANIINSHAAYTYLVGSCAGGASGTGNVTTTPINTTGATLIEVIIGTSLGAGNYSTPTDSQSNSFSFGLGSFQNSSDCWLHTYIIVNPSTSASYTVSDAPSVDDYPGICAIAFSGSPSPVSSIIDGYSGANVLSSTSLQTGNITTSYNNDLLVSAVCTGASAGTVSINDSFTIPTGMNLLSVSAQYYGLTVAYLNQSTWASINPTWSETGTENMVANIVGLVPAQSSITGGTLNSYNAKYYNANKY